MSWGPEKMLIRCSKESQHPAEWTPGPPVEHQNEKDNVAGQKSGGQNIAVSVRSPAPSHTQTLSNPFRTLAIKWEVHIFLKKSSCVFIIVSLWCCRWQYNTNGSPNLGQKTRPYSNQQQKKRTCKIVDFAVLADHRIKLKQCEKKDKYLNLARELKKLWNMKVTIVPIVIGAFGTVTKGLLNGLEDLEVGGRVETIQTTALLRMARILRRVQETCCHSNSSERPSANTDVKNSRSK